MAPTISVIIPCYRQAHFLPQAIAAVQNQTLKDIQIVVVNDGSDDNTEAIAREYGDQITYVSKPNGGLSSARNAGIQAATGRYLYFLDADDSIHPEALERLHALIANRDDTVAMMGYKTFEDEKTLDLLARSASEGFAPPLKGGGGSVAEDLRIVDESEAPTSPLEGEVDATEAKPNERRVGGINSSLLPWILIRNYPVHCYLVPRALVDRAGVFDTQMKSHEDHDFWVRIAMQSPKMSCVPFSGAWYRQHPDSMSRHQPTMHASRVMLNQRIAGYLSEHSEVARKYGSIFLRHLYVMELQNTIHGGKTNLHDAITLMHRTGVRSPKPIVDTLYRFTPRFLRPLAMRMVVLALRILKPGKYRQLKDNSKDS